MNVTREEYLEKQKRIRNNAKMISKKISITPEIERQIQAQATAPKEGPGTELKKLLEELGFFGFNGCSCAETIRWMNAEGPDKCLEAKDAIVKKLKDGQRFVSWWGMAKAGILGVTSGIAFKLNLAHPIESLVEEACRRAKEKSSEPSKSG